MRYLVAVAVAVVLVGSALGVRAWITDDSSDTSGTDSGTDELPVIACSTDLGTVCDALDDAVDGEASLVPLAPGDVVDAQGEPEWDAWVTTDIWADLASLNLDFGEGSERNPVAGGQLALVTTTKTSARLDAGCTAEPLRVEVSLTWDCIAAATSATPGLGLDDGEPVVIGLGPVDGTDSLLAATALVTALQGSTDFDAAALEGNVVRDALEDLAAAGDASGQISKLLIQPSSYQTRRCDGTGGGAHLRRIGSTGRVCPQRRGAAGRRRARGRQAPG